MARALVNDGICELICGDGNPDRMAEVLTNLGMQAIDTGSYLLYPFVERIERRGITLIVTVALEIPA
jgi:hypothetical protein